MVRVIGSALAILMIVAGCGADPESVAIQAQPEATTSASASASTPPVPGGASSSAPSAAAAVKVPAGVTAGVAVYDRQAAAYTVRHNIDQRFRSASLVKLLIAIDYLWDRETVAAADRQRLDIMLSRSDDNAASHYYNLGGRAAIIARMNQRLGLTVVPPTAPRTGWGSTEVSAAHLVRVYRYLLDEAPQRIGGYIVGRIRSGTFTKCGTDRFDQSFGIPAAFAGRPWAAKQGWYEFATAPKNCTSATPATLAEPPAALTVPPAALTVPVAAPVDFTGEALHTTGIVGPNDRSIVVILTVHPRGTAFGTATTVVTKFATTLPLPT